MQHFHLFGVLYLVFLGDTSCLSRQMCNIHSSRGASVLWWEERWEKLMFMAWYWCICMWPRGRWADASLPSPYITRIITTHGCGNKDSMMLLWRRNEQWTLSFTTDGSIKIKKCTHRWIDQSINQWTYCSHFKGINAKYLSFTTI